MSSSRVFYGCWVTLAFSVMVFVSAGVRHAMGPFLKPMVADLGVASAVACVLLAAAGLVSLHVDREPRRLRWARASVRAVSWPL